MKKKSISNKAFLVLLFGTVIMVLLSSCSADEHFTEINNLDTECVTDGVEQLEGEYASQDGSIVYYFNANATFGVRQDGILNGVSSFCFTSDSSHLKTVNEFNQTNYILYSIVDTLYVKGIVLDGEFYELLN